VEAAGRAVSILGGRLLPAVDYVIPGTDITHRLVRVEKVRPTPAKYPRRFAKMKKEPLDKAKK
jgi:16S rRNA (guanine527-N7)-methyltransferase